MRGALSAGPLLLGAVLADRTSLGVVAAIAAMLAGTNDRPGGRRVSVKRIGGPALAGALGTAVGTYAGEYTGALALTVLLTLVGLVAGGISAVGPVASGAGTQLLVGSAIGAGMPLPDQGWLRAVAYLTGACWLLALRLLLPTPGAIAGDFRFDGEREAVAGVYEAVAGLLDAVGTERATDRRVALTAALDHAQDALTGPRLRRYASSAAERRLHAQYAAALPLAEAATALAWAGEAVPGRASAGPRRLAVAVRENTHTGPLPAPTRSAPALRALDDALLRAAEAFDGGWGGGGGRGGRGGAGGRGGPGGWGRRGGPGGPGGPGGWGGRGGPGGPGGWGGRGGDLHTRRLTVRDLLRSVFGAGGREYGLRVALCFGASAAVAQALHRSHWYGEHAHWYWLPATAAFLVKPDLGPLASRVLCRAAGTVLGALVFAGFALVLPRPGGLIALVAVGGALIPVAARHFAAQTAVVTVLVLALVMVGGEPQASASRITETLLACAIVLIVGHLPMPGQRGGGVRSRLAAAGEAAQAYLAHVLRESGGSVVRGECGSPVVRESERRVWPERPVVGESVRPVPRESGGSAVRESEGTVVGESEGTVVRENERPVPRESELPVVRELEGSVPRESVRTALRGAGSVVRGGAGEDSRAVRWTLRREAYRALAEARAAIVLAAAELPALARHSEGADQIVTALERIVDTTTACAVHLDDSGRLTPGHVRRLTELLDELDRLDEGRGRVEVRLPEVPLAG